MSLSNLNRDETIHLAAALAALAVIVGVAAMARLDSDQAQNLWLAALGLMLVPSWRTGAFRQQADIGAILAAIVLSIASVAFGADPAWTGPLIFILLCGSLVVQMHPEDLTWFVPGSAISLLILLGITSLLGQPEVGTRTEIFGATLAALACSFAIASIEWDNPEMLASAGCLALATVTSIGATLDASRMWITCSILLVGSSQLIRIMQPTEVLPRPACNLTLKSHFVATAAVGLVAGTASLVATSTSDIELRWQITALVGSGIVGLGSVASLWRTSHGDQIRQFEEARRESRTDALTGLPNRREIQERLEKEFARSIRYHHALSLLMIDLDDFKSINDRFGHVGGDEALRRAAQAIDASIRSIDLAGRYGGEEFLVILPETATYGADVVAERIRSTVEQTGNVTVSIGLTSLDSQTTDPAVLIEQADEALYTAKRAGKNRVALFA